MKENYVAVTEVGPRDGFQNLKGFLPTNEKLKIIDGLVSAGFKSIEITSFVSPKAVPQMADSMEVARACLESYPGLDLVALVPNLYGAKAAYNIGIRHVNYVISLSVSHNMANIRRTHEQSFAELDSILETLPELEVCVSVATAFGCPFEGRPDIDKVVEFSRRVYNHGVQEITLADTIGDADPRQIRDTIAAVREMLPHSSLRVHVHDTRGMGIASTLAAIESCVNAVETAVGGLGGCPFAPGASGNTATEDLIYMLERMGYKTGIDLNKLMSVSRYQCSVADGVYSGHQIRIKPCEK